MNGHQALCHCHFGKVTNASQVVRAAECHRAHAKLFGTFNAHLHGLHTCDLAVATLAIQVQQGTCVEHHFDPRVGIQTTFQNGIDIARDHAHTMRVMTTQIGHDQVGGHLLGFSSIAAGHSNDVGNLLLQLCGGNALAHDSTFLLCNATGKAWRETWLTSQRPLAKVQIHFDHSRASRFWWVRQRPLSGSSRKCAGPSRKC